MPFLASFGGGSARGFNPGSSGFDWGQFSTGDEYQGGYIRVIDSTTLQWWFYPTQRTNGQTNAGGSLESTVTLEGAASVRFFVFGGGGGGSGTNGSGGGGGGFASSVSATTLSAGQVISYQGGGAGLGGVCQDVTGLSNLSYLGSMVTATANFSTSGLESYVFLGTSSDSTSFYLRALGGTTKHTVNPTQYSDCGQGGSGIVQTNTLGLSTNVGSGGDGGSRSLRGGSGVGGGGGGGNSNGGSGLDTGGASTKAGGGGGGNGHDATPSSSQNGGGNGGTYGFDGGMGGDSNAPIAYGFQGDGLKTEVSSSFPVGGGYAYQLSDNTGWGATVLGRGSAGGGGFPGGGGGSSYFGGSNGNFGVGGDGASGAVMLQIGF